MSVSEYEARFHELVGCISMVFSIEHEEVQSFIRGLILPLFLVSEHLVAAVHTFTQVVGHARFMESLCHKAYGGDDQRPRHQDSSSDASFSGRVHPKRIYHRHSQLSRLIRGMLGRAARVQVQLLWFRILGIRAVVANLFPPGALTRRWMEEGVMIVAILVTTLGSARGTHIFDRISGSLVGFHLHLPVVMYRVFGVVPRVLEADLSWVGQVVKQVFNTEVDIVMYMYFR